jgi:drug/metabolite transporter (DMT)-like permease
MAQLLFHKFALLATSIICMTGFLNAVRWGQARGARFATLAVFNYITAFSMFLLTAIFEHLRPQMPVALHGITIGLLYGTSFFLILYGMENFGVAKTTTVANLSQVIPVCASIVLWGERPSLLVIIGIITSAAAIPLILLPAGRREPAKSRIAVLGMIGLFVAQGLAYTVLKSYEQLNIPQQRPILLVFLFGTAATLTASVAILGRNPVRLVDISSGMLVGLFNGLNNFSLAAALSVAAATIVFPTFTAGTIILTTIASMIIWRERYTPRAWAGLALAVASVILINL